MAVKPPAAPVPVFAAIGAGAWGPVQELRGRPELRLVATPRHAMVLLAAGSVPAEHAEALDRVHDQLPHPRTAIGWAGSGRLPVTSRTVRGGIDSVVAAALEAHRALLDEPQSTSPDRMPDEEPNQWRGVGPYGQGGEGMMGGTPYGRPMAMTGDDRDGLALDQLHVPLGPFLETVPPGVVLHATVQGEVIQQVHAALASPQGAGAPVPDSAPASVAARQARDGLRWLAHGLHLHGLDALSVRAARLSTAAADPQRPLAGLATPYRRLRRAVRRSGLLWTIAGVGAIDGLADGAQRWRRRLDAIETVIEDAPCDPEPAMVSWQELCGWLTGSTLSDAITTIWSLHDRLAVPAEVLA